MTSEKPPKVSEYVEAGSPTQCFIPSCRKWFEGAAIHGKDSHYYCSETCADLANTIDLTHVQELRPKAPPAFLSPRQKLFVGKTSQ